MVTDRLAELSSIGPSPASMQASLERIADTVTVLYVMLESGMNEIRDVLDRDYPGSSASYAEYTPLQIAAAVQRAFDRTKNAKLEINDALPPRYGGPFSLDEIPAILRGWRDEEDIHLRALARGLACSANWKSIVGAVTALKKRNEELETALAAMKVPQA
jgi:hypothetical protein